MDILAAVQRKTSLKHENRVLDWFSLIDYRYPIV
jgi:hypothetical protein